MFFVFCNVLWCLCLLVGIWLVVLCVIVVMMWLCLKLVGSLLISIV